MTLKQLRAVRKSGYVDVVRIAESPTRRDDEVCQKSEVASRLKEFVAVQPSNDVDRIGRSVPTLDLRSFLIFKMIKETQCLLRLSLASAARNLMMSIDIRPHL